MTAKGGAFLAIGFIGGAGFVLLGDMLGGWDGARIAGGIVTAVCVLGGFWVLKMGGMVR